MPFAAGSWICWIPGPKFLITTTAMAFAFSISVTSDRRPDRCFAISWILIPAISMRENSGPIDPSAMWSPKCTCMSRISGT